MFDVTAMVNPWETMNKNISHYLCCMFLSYFSALILNDSWYVKVLHEKWGTTSAATSEANVHDERRQVGNAHLCLSGLNKALRTFHWLPPHQYNGGNDNNLFQFLRLPGWTFHCSLTSSVSECIEADVSVADLAITTLHCSQSSWNFLQRHLTALDSPLKF